MNTEKRFEQNRKDLLQQLNQLRREKAVKRKVDQIQQKFTGTSTAGESAARKVEKVTAVLYGAKSLFISKLIPVLQTSCTIFHFDNHEKAESFILDNNISHIILDMDQPTDWKSATDIFSSTKIMFPNSRFLLCSMDPSAVPVQTLVAQGATVAPKPVSAEDLYGFLHDKG
jgi:hypothetical protein